MEVETGNIPENLVERDEVVAGHTVKVRYSKDDTEYRNPIGAKEPKNIEDLDSWKKRSGKRD